MGTRYHYKRVPHRVHRPPPKLEQTKIHRSTYGSFTTTSIRARDFRPPPQRSGHQDNGRGGAPLPFILLSHPEKGRRVASYLEPPTPELLLNKAEEFQDGDTRHNYPHSTGGNVGDKRRPKRRLLTYSHGSKPPTLSSFQLPGSGLQIRSPSFRPCNSSKSLLQSHKYSCSRTTETRGSPLCLPRRLVNTGTLGGASLRKHQANSRPSSKPRLVIINLSKSQLIPSQQIRYLGAVLNFVNGTVLPSPERIETLLLLTQTISLNTHSTAADWLRLLGYMASLVDLVPFCRLRMRPLQLHLLATFKPISRDLSVLIPIDPVIVPHLAWWANPRNWASGTPFSVERRLTSITTDASLLGWGGFWDNEMVSGQWTTEFSSKHINHLELEAVSRTLHYFQSHLKNHLVTVFTDSTTVVSYINRQGGTHSPSLCVETWNLWNWCITHKIFLRASYIAGITNTLADALSRGRVNQGEWSLAPAWCKAIFNHFGTPLVDLFASPLNAKLPTFVTRTFHAQAWETDALSLPWDYLDAYAFPPFSLIHRILPKTRKSRVRLLLVAPLWPRRPWFPVLLHLLMDNPLIIPLIQNIVSQHRGTILHTNVQHLHLAAWKISGLMSHYKAFQIKLPILRPDLDDDQLLSLTIPDFVNSNSGVMNIRFIQLKHL